MSLASRQLASGWHWPAGPLSPSLPPRCWRLVRVKRAGGPSTYVEIGRMATAARCGCGAVTLALDGACRLSFGCWCDQCRAGALYCHLKGGPKNTSAVTSLGGVQNALYRCDQVAVTSGADSLVAVKSTQATDGFNPTRFYCSSCNTYICLTDRQPQRRPSGLCAQPQVPAWLLRRSGGSIMTTASRRPRSRPHAS